MFTQITNPTGEQICFCDTKWPLAKLLIFVNFILFYYFLMYGVEVIFISGFQSLLCVKIMGDGIFSQGFFRNRHEVNIDLMTM